MLMILFFMNMQKILFHILRFEILIGKKKIHYKLNYKNERELLFELVIGELSLKHNFMQK